MSNYHSPIPIPNDKRFQNVPHKDGIVLNDKKNTVLNYGKYLIWHILKSVKKKLVEKFFLYLELLSFGNSLKFPSRVLYLLPFFLSFIQYTPISS